MAIRSVEHLVRAPAVVGGTVLGLEREGFLVLDRDDVRHLVAVLGAVIRAARGEGVHIGLSLEARDLTLGAGAVQGIAPERPRGGVAALLARDLGFLVDAAALAG